MEIQSYRRETRSDVHDAYADDRDIPEWFAQAVASTAITSEVEVAGAVVRSRCWGAPGPGVILVHGGGAHARWWDHIAPLLADEYRVVAIDLTGHGTSDRRESYELSTWAEETMVAALASGITGRPVVIGHSMGGEVALTAGAIHGDEIAGVITVDTPIPTEPPEVTAARPRRVFGSVRYYPTAAEARSHFRTVPPDPHIRRYVLDYIAEASVVEREEGWTWAFDPKVFERPRLDPELLRRVTCRVGVFRAERGLVTADIGAQIYELLDGLAPVVCLPFAGHHAMLDEPIALVASLRTLLAAWSHSAPILRVSHRRTSSEGGSTSSSRPNHWRSAVREIR